MCVGGYFTELTSKGEQEKSKEAPTRYGNKIPRPTGDNFMLYSMRVDYPYHNGNIHNDKCY